MASEASGHGYSNFTVGGEARVHAGDNYNVTIYPEPTVKPKPRSTVPFGKDPHFVGREDILGRLDSTFSEPDGHKRVALTGLGGVGKSKIAVEFSHRHRDQNPEKWVFWVHASTKDRIVQAFQEIAEIVQIPTRNDPQADLLSLVRRWLSDENNGPWLMIIDNADDNDVFFSSNVESDRPRQDDNKAHALSFYIPQASHGSILITSRNQAGPELVGSYGTSEPVGQFDHNTAVELLQRKLPTLNKDAEDAHVLARLLDYIPLAINQATAYIARTRITIAKYISAFRSNEEMQEKLLSRALADIRGQATVQNAVVTSWKISFDQIKQTSIASADLLSLLSMLDRQGVPESLVFVEGADDLELQEAIGVLLDYSLVSQEDNNDAASYSMHRLVQICVRTWLKQDECLRFWERKALGLLGEKFPSGRFDTWTECKSLLPHARKVLEYIVDSEMLVADAALCGRVGWYLEQQRDYPISEALAKQAIALCDRNLGTKHQDTMQLTLDLASQYKRQGRYSQAEPLLKGLLAEMDGQTDFNNLYLWTNKKLATIYDSQRRFSEAESLLKRALEEYDKQQGLQHQPVARVVSHLACVLSKQSKYSEAEPLFWRAISRSGEMPDPQNRFRLHQVRNLAGTYRQWGKYDIAESLFKWAIEGQKRKLGARHRDTLDTVEGLALSYPDQGRDDEARALLSMWQLDEESRSEVDYEVEIICPGPDKIGLYQDTH